MTAERASAAFSASMGVAAARLARRARGTRREMCISVEGGLSWRDAEEDIKVDLESKLANGGDVTRQRDLYTSSFHSCSRFVLKEGQRTPRHDDSQMKHRALPATLRA